MNYKKMATQIIKNVGGESNIHSVVHCITRLRFELADREKANVKELEKIPGVISVNVNKSVFQVIIGTEVTNVYEEIKKLIGSNDENQKRIKKSIFHEFLSIMQDAAIPIANLFIIIGFALAINSLLQVTGIITAESTLSILLSSVNSALLFFISVFFAKSTAKKMGVNEYEAMLLAVILLSDQINGVEGLNLFGMQLPAVTYSGTFISVIIAVVFMSFVNKGLDKIIPGKIKSFVGPFISLTITLLFTLLIFGPLGVYIGNGFSWLFQQLQETFGSWIVVFIWASIQPIVILSGANGFMVPIVLMSFTEVGYDMLFTPAGLASDAAVAGVVLAIFLKTKNKHTKEISFSAFISALLGVTEPANFGVFLPLKKPYIAAAIGGGLGGLVAGISGLKAYSWVCAAIYLPTYIGNNDYHNFYIAVATVVVSAIGGFVASWFIRLDEKNDMTDDLDTSKELFAPVKGEIINLKDVNDDVFASEALGKGIAILPEEGIIKSPIQGKVTALLPTKHAIGITSQQGMEILIHIGFDTVSLQGEGFQSVVNQGDSVEIGQELIKFDKELIQKKGYDCTVVCVITNSKDYENIHFTTKNHVDALQSIMMVEGGQ